VSCFKNKGDPPLYPKAYVEIENDNTSDKPSDHILDPQTDQAYPEWSWAHLTRPEIIGDSMPGKNRVMIKTMEKTKNPFRLVGIIMCGACVEVEESLAATSIRVRVPDRV